MAVGVFDFAWKEFCKPVGSSGERFQLRMLGVSNMHLMSLAFSVNLLGDHDCENFADFATGSLFQSQISIHFILRGQFYFHEAVLVTWLDVWSSLFASQWAIYV